MSRGSTLGAQALQVRLMVLLWTVRCALIRDLREREETPSLSVRWLFDRRCDNAKDKSGTGFGRVHVAYIAGVGTSCRG